MDKETKQRLIGNLLMRMDVEINSVESECDYIRRSVSELRQLLKEKEGEE